MLSKAVKGGFNEPPFGPALLHYVACIQKDRLGLSSRLLFAIHDLADKAAIVCMRRSGTGTMRYANGDIFEGQWANDMKNGPGVYYYADGAVYEGVWQEDIAKMWLLQTSYRVRGATARSFASLAAAKCTACACRCRRQFATCSILLRACFAARVNDGRQCSSAVGQQVLSASKEAALQWRYANGDMTESMLTPCMSFEGL